MEPKSFEWQASDGKRIRGLHWEHPQARRVVVIVHGFAEHVGRYDDLARYLLQSSQAAVLGSDRRGHGRSEGKRGHFTRIGLLLEEIQKGIQLAREHYPDIPIYLYGHSMGGMLVLSYAVRHSDPDLSGIVSSAPWLQLAFEPPAWRVSLAYLANRIWPALPQPTGMDTSALCTDPQVVRAYEEDPLVHRTITPGTAVAMFEEGKQLNQYRSGMPVPTLLMHGLDDRITSVAHSRAFTERNAKADFKGWPGLFHEIHHEPNWREVADYATIWMSSILAD